MLYGFELDKQVSLRDVYEALEKVTLSAHGGGHEIDLGDAGWHTIDCESEDIKLDVETLIREIGEM